MKDGRPVFAQRKPPPFVGWLLLSLFVHGAIAWRMAYASGLFLSRGEAGYEGGGGATFEVTVEGASAPERPPIPSDEGSVATTGQEARLPVATPTRTLVRERRERDPNGPRGEQANEPQDGANATPEATASAPPIAGSGTDDTTTDSGRTAGPDEASLRALLSASVGAPGGSSAGMRSLLAAAARCPDPIEGTWLAFRYSPEFRDWARFTLHIDRDGARLRGTIETRMWRGLPGDRHPPEICLPEAWDYTVEQRATGSVTSGQFDFGSREHHISQVHCSSPTFAYNPDHFSGTFDLDADRLRTVNNDGGRDVDAPYTFRRSSCEP